MYHVALASLISLLGCSPMKASPTRETVLASTSGGSNTNTPPPPDGAALYASKCASCHGELATSTKRNSSVAKIAAAIASTVPAMNMPTLTLLSKEELTAIASVLSDVASSTPTPTPAPQQCGSSASLIAKSVHAHRLSNDQYSNVARDLLGITTSPGRGLPATLSKPFDNNSEFLGGTSSLMADSYWLVARDLATTAVTNNLAKIAVCVPTPMMSVADVNACVRTSIADFATLAFRRPPAPETITDLKAVYDRATATTFPLKFAQVIRAVLASPRFIFQFMELAAPESPVTVELDAYALASRISFFLWNSIPDRQLLAAAKSGALLTAAGLDEQMERMLADEKSNALASSFAAQWLDFKDIGGLTVDSSEFPGFDNTLLTSARTESVLYFDDIVKNDKSLYEVLTGEASFIDPNLGSLYGVATSGPGHKLTVLPRNQRRGMVTQASVMIATTGQSNRTIPIHRGLWVMSSLLCEAPEVPNIEIPPLPNDKGGIEYTEGQIRERLEVHRKVGPACTACHATMDPVGLAFESYNSIGGMRTQYKSDGLPVDASGEAEFVHTGGVRQRAAFSDAIDLTEKLAQDERVPACMTEHLLTYALHRSVGADEKCAVKELATLNVDRSKPISALVKAIVQSPAFRSTKGGE